MKSSLRIENEVQLNAQRRARDGQRTYFDYIAKLDTAISNVCAQLHADGHSLKLQDIDLTEAYKRLLYFRYRDSSELFSCFASGDAKSATSFRSEIERRLAAHLSDFVTCDDCRERPSLMEAMKRSKFLLANRPYRPGSNSKSTDAVKFLFVPSSEKFYRVLNPVVSAIGAQAAFLCTNNNDSPSTSSRILRDSTRCRWRGEKTWKFDPAGFRILNSSSASMYSALRRLSPKCVVVCEGNAPLDGVVGAIGKSLGIPVGCIQHGWSPFLHTGFRNMPFDRFFIWGQRFREILETANDPSIFHTIGAYQLSIQPKRTAYLNNAVGVLLQHKPKGNDRFGLIDSRAWDETLQITRGAASQFPEIEFRIRTHPGSPELDLQEADLGDLANVKHIKPDQETISQFFSSIDLTISAYSTTLYESVQAGVLPIILQVTSMKDFLPDLHADGIAESVCNAAQLSDVITRYYDQPNWRGEKISLMQRQSPNYFSAVGDEATETIVSELEKLAANSTPIGAR